jgi:catechol 2,3-dioxygenase-like lactoylglutathione lyase family enzyme
MSVRLEHANLCVRDLAETIRFVCTAFPEFRLRGEGPTWSGGRWVHIGTDDTYLALTQATAEPGGRFVPYSDAPGTNHLGYEVDDVEALRQRMLAAGYRETSVANHHPHRRRVYFADGEGNDWEFVEYASGRPEERNDYTLADR